MPRAQKIALLFLGTYFLILALAMISPPAYDFLISKPVQTFDRLKGIQAWRNEAYTKWFYYPARNDKKGLSVYEPGKTYGDYTLFSDARAQKAYLVDMEGKTVHIWEKPFDAAWPDPKIEIIPPQNKIFWCRVFAQPNGDLFVQYCFDAPGNKAVGLMKLDKDSNVIWRYEGFSHHDMEIAPNGDIYVLANEMRQTAHPALPFAAPPYIEEFIIRLNSKGEEVEKISVFDMLANSPARSVLLLLGSLAADPKLGSGDLFHPNTITRVPEALDGAAPMLKAGRYLVSFRNIDLLAIFDLEEKRATWASYGPWHGQHSPEFAQDGSMVLFDNEGNLSREGGPSRILKIDLNTLGILWQYSGNEDDPVYSPYNGFVQPLPNGNILVSESTSGRLFEITKDKEIVWDYYVPDRLTDKNGTSRMPSVYTGHRFTEAELPFLKQEARH